jgi:hypothetical protein
MVMTSLSVLSEPRHGGLRGNNADGPPFDHEKQPLDGLSVIVTHPGGH